MVQAKPKAEAPSAPANSSKALVRSSKLAKPALIWALIKASLVAPSTQLFAAMFKSSSFPTMAAPAGLMLALMARKWASKTAPACLACPVARSAWLIIAFSSSVKGRAQTPSVKGFSRTDLIRAKLMCSASTAKSKRRPAAAVAASSANS